MFLIRFVINVLALLFVFLVIWQLQGNNVVLVAIGFGFLRRGDVPSDRVISLNDLAQRVQRVSVIAPRPRAVLVQDLLRPTRLVPHVGRARSVEVRHARHTAVGHVAWAVLSLMAARRGV